MDERCILDIFLDGPRMRTVGRMNEVLPHVDDGEMRELLKGTMCKLLKISDVQFKDLIQSGAHRASVTAADAEEG